MKRQIANWPFIRADWFIATASLPPLYHDILDLPKTDRELETQLEVNVAENLKNAPSVRVWRAGFNNSGVSVNNRIVERHKSRYGAYWKSYDFAGMLVSRISLRIRLISRMMVARLFSICLTDCRRTICLLPPVKDLMKHRLISCQMQAREILLFVMASHAWVATQRV